MAGMKKIYVFGDSFMERDPRYPGEHWSEMISEYKVVMRSQSGSSNGMIAYELFRSLSEKPDAVVVGFTAQFRLNFDMPPDGKETHKGRIWYNNGARDYITKDQKLACDYYAATVSEKMVLFETYVLMRSLFLTLEKNKIPYAWQPLMLDNNLADPRCFTDDWKTVLSEFESKKIPLNLATHREFKDIPGFHTHDRDWQYQFAQQALEIIQQQVDFYKK